jgi:hypothetical protein
LWIQIAEHHPCSLSRRNGCAHRWKTEPSTIRSAHES